MALKHRPDMVMMDITMPVLDGISAAGEILAEFSCPILFTTGLSDSKTLKRAQEIDVQAYLVKPFTPDQLKSAVQMALAGHRKSLSAEFEISKLREELDANKTVDQALQLMIQQYQIRRDEALDQLGTMALNRGCTLVEAARRAIELLQAPA